MTIASGLASMRACSRPSTENYNNEWRGKYISRMDGGENVPVPKSEKNRKIDRFISSVIMVWLRSYSGARVFTEPLASGWVVFAIGGILCGIVSVVVKAIYGEK
ncbi:MAG: hypothetical protein ACLRSW_13560 [Christensenellaceae bacterium]